MALVALPDGEADLLQIDPRERLVVGSFSPDGQCIAVLDEAAGLYVYVIATSEYRLLWRDASAGHSSESGVAWSPSGETLAVTIWDRAGSAWPGTVLLDAANGRELAYREHSCLSPASSDAWTDSAGLFVRDFASDERVELGEEHGEPDRPARGVVLGRLADGRRIVSRNVESQSVLLVLERDGSDGFTLCASLPAVPRAVRARRLLVR